MTIREVRMPKFPECWESCGSCAQGEIFILELFVQPGDRISRDDNILTMETGKVALDIPCPWDGVIQSVHVTEGDYIDEGALLITLESP